MTPLEFFKNRYREIEIQIEKAESDKKALKSFNKRKHKQYFIDRSKEQQTTAKEWIFSLV